MKRAQTLTWNVTVVDTQVESHPPLWPPRKDLNNNNNYDNLYGAVTRPYRYKGTLQATTLGRP